MVNIPAFQNTPIERIPVIHERLSKSFLSHKTRPLEWRLTQLRKLYWGYVPANHYRRNASNLL
jgi:beta-apo-4'-carotenal oxygenase